MKRFDLFAVSAITGLCVLTACYPVFANDGVIPLTQERAQLAATLPVYVIPLHPRLRAQMPVVSINGQSADSRRHVANFSISGFLPVEAAAFASAAGRGALPQLISQSVILEQGGARAQRNFDAVEQAHCDLPIDGLQSAVTAAVRRSAWGAAIEPKTDFFADGRLDTKRLPPKDEPRLVFVVGAGYSVDFANLMTTVDIMAYSPQGQSGSSWKREPRWLSSFVVVSDPVRLAPKTAADIEIMIQAEQRRYANTGNEALARKVNADGFNADRRQRQTATTAATLHKRIMKLAAESEWSQDAEELRQSQLWAENDCARTRTALEQGRVEIGRMLDTHFAQGGTPEGGPADTATAGASGLRRALYALPGELYVSRHESNAVDLSSRHYLLPGKK